MSARFGLRLSLAAGLFASALLVACGGGGGGGGVTPTTNTTTPTPTPASTLAPATQSTSAPIGTSGGTVNLGGVQNSGGTANAVSSAAIVLPALSQASTGTFSLSASAPSAVATPFAARVQIPVARTKQVQGSLCSTPCTLTALAYITISFTPSVQITQSPHFTVTFPSNVALTAGNAYVLAYSTAIGTNWAEVTGPITVAANATSLDFPSAAVNPSPFTLQAGVNYTFAIVTTGSAVIGTPTPSPTPSPTQAPTNANLPTAGPTLLPTTAPGNAGWSPSQVAAAFNFPINNNGASTGWNGQGQTIVIIGDNPPLASDLTTFLGAFGLSSRPAYTPVSVNGTDPTDGGGQFEATLDLQTVLSLAPAANVEFYEVKDTTGASFTQAYNQILTDSNHPAVFSISFGGCEGAYDFNTDAPIFAQMATAGISVFASSGDQGNECYNGTGFSPGVNYPASDPNVTGVGGNETATSLTSNAVWNDNFFATTPPQGASGGGVSTQFTIPSYQSGLAGISSATHRNVPDITMPSVGVAIYSSGSWGGALGTSWSAPEAAAMTAEINEYCGGSFLASAGSSPVARWYTAYTRSASNFLDITANSTYNTNGNQYGTATPVYYPGVGYDNVSGLGAPYGYLVMNSLCPNRTPAARPMGSMAIAAIDSYGESRDTSLGYVPNIGAGNDLGARGSESVEVTLVMRATQSLASDEQSVIASLRSAGFSITKTYPNHLVIVAEAPASVVGSYFGTSIHNVTQGRFGVRYANVTPVILPASIARVVHGAIVDNMVTMRPLSEHRGNRASIP